jgi:hypothetical protein
LAARLNDYPATNRDLCAVGKHKAGDLGIDMHAVNLFSDSRDRSKKLMAFLIGRRAQKELNL